MPWDDGGRRLPFHFLLRWLSGFAMRQVFESQVARDECTMRYSRRSQNVPDSRSCRRWLEDEELAARDERFGIF